MTVEKRLTELRKQKGLNQAELAEALGVSAQAISRWERGAARPSTEKLIELSQFYEVDLNVLVGGDAPPPAAPEPPAEAKQEGKPNTPAPHGALRYILGAVCICFEVLCAAVCIIVFTLHAAPKEDEREVIPIEELESDIIQIRPEDYIDFDPW